MNHVNSAGVLLQSWGDWTNQSSSGVLCKADFHRPREARGYMLPTMNKLPARHMALKPQA
jgi:hypothetical protein